jgi:nucleotide-binding universal stress UspA family protein
VVFRSILVAVDGSPAATKALEEAIAIARADGARLTLISVASRPRWPISMGPYAMPLWTDADLERQAEEILDRAFELVPEDIPVSTFLGHGPVATAILNRIEAACHDLVVMGSRGLGPAGRLVLGSVSRAVFAASAVPVLIARADPSPAGDRTLVGTT